MSLKQFDASEHAKWIRLGACIALAAAAATLGSAEASAQVTIDGRVVAASTAAPVSGATVMLVGQVTVTSDSRGAFRLSSVPPGRYSLRVAALGYTDQELTLVALRDTSIVVELDPAPIQLDTLAVTARFITVHGQVKEAASGLGLIDVDVELIDFREVRTDGLGRFRMNRVPAGPDATIVVRGFGYLPIERSFTTNRDTALAFQLEPDPVVQQMISAQVARIEQRGHGLRSAILTPIGRAELLRNLNATVYDLVQQRYASRTSRIRCLLIDDVQIKHSGLGVFARGGPAEELRMILPDQVERIEIIDRDRVMRVYTREFIRKMVAGGVRLRSPLYVGPPEVPGEPYCR